MTAATEKLAIVNKALLRMRHGGITEAQFASDSTNVIGKLAYSIFEEEAEAVLKEVNWRCVSKQSESLTAAASASAEYDYAYLLPSDFAKINGAVLFDGYELEREERHPYRLGLDADGNRVLMARYAAAISFGYVYKDFESVDYYAQMDGELKKAIQLKLMAEMGFAVTNNASFILSIDKKYQEAILLARSHNKVWEPQTSASRLVDARR